MNKAVFKTDWWGLFTICATYMFVSFLIIILGLLVFALSGCSPAKRINDLSYKHPALFAKPCAMLFPVTVKDSIVERWHAGEVSYSFDTVTVDCDSVTRYVDRNHTRTVRIPVQVASLRVDTFTKEIYREKENTAKTAVAEKRATDAESKTDRLKKGRDTWRIIGLVGLALVVGGAVLKLVGSKLI